MSVNTVTNSAALGKKSRHHQSRDVYDGKGMYAIPRLIDSHLHIESSMITPPRFEAVLSHGTTTVAIDPHEICNVSGKRGVKMI